MMLKIEFEMQIVMGTTLLRGRRVEEIFPSLEVVLNTNLVLSKLAGGIVSLRVFSCHVEYGCGAE
jgi:hypothetical protein